MARIFSKIKDALIEQEDNEQESLSPSEYADLLRQANLGTPNTPTAWEQYSEEEIEVSEDVLNPSDIYAQNDMAIESTAKNIFKIAELRDALPANLPTESKKQTVINMMPISGLTIEEVLDDAETRQAILQQTLESNNAYCNSSITESKNQIAQFEAQIEALKVDIQSKEKLIEDNTKVINAEYNKIQSIKDFIIK